jgi:hypothetical protein
MQRKLFWAVLVVGLALVIAPFVISLPSKASAGQRMMDGFRPIMQSDQVALTAHYYDDVFTPLGKVVPLFAQMPPSMQTGFGQMLRSAQVDPAIFGEIPAGLQHYGPLVRTMQANVDNYAQIDSLPSFRLFTWFFVIPGVLLLLIAVFGLWGDALRAHTHLHRVATP